MQARGQSKGRLVLSVAEEAILVRSPFEDHLVIWCLVFFINDTPIQGDHISPAEVIPICQGSDGHLRRLAADREGGVGQVEGGVQSIAGCYPQKDILPTGQVGQVDVISQR